MDDSELGGYPLTPRFILSDCHVSLAVSKKTRSHKYYSYRELDQSFSLKDDVVTNVVTRSERSKALKKATKLGNVVDKLK